MFVPSKESEPAPAEAPAEVPSDSEPEEHVPFAWTKTPVTGTGSTSANPTELATAFDGKVWNLLEGKLDILNVETDKKLRDTIQRASVEANTQVSGASAGASSSSAAAAANPPTVAPKPIDTTAWESDARFKHNLRYLAWMRRKDGSPPPVFVEPGTYNPMEVDYTIDE